MGTEAPNRNELKARLLQAKILTAEAEARRAILVIEELDRNEQTRLERLSLDNVYELCSSIDNTTVQRCGMWLEDRRLRAPRANLELRLSSPGGSVFSGLALMDSMKYARKSGNTITAVIQGVAASMAGIVAQAANLRVIAQDSYLMIHTVSQGVVGRMDTAQFTDQAELFKRLTMQGCKAYADRSGGIWTAEALYEKTLREDWWLSADQALAEGFVDQVR